MKLLCCLLGLILGCPIVQAAEQRTLQKTVFALDTAFASNHRGHILSYRKASSLFELWGEDGKLIKECQLPDPRLQGSIFLLALREGVALLTLLEPEAGSEDKRKVVTVDLGRCEVRSTFALPGVVVGASEGPDGWLVASQGQIPGEFSYFLVDDHGKVLAELTLPAAVRDEAQARGLPAGLARLVAFRKSVLMLPGSVYGLWFAAQNGRPSRQVPMPTCMKSAGRWLEGEESANELRRRAASASEETRQAVEEFLRQSAARGKAPRGYLGAVASFAVREDRLAVVVRDASLGGCRLDVWDLTLEEPIAVAQIPGHSCPGFVALASDGYWLRSNTGTLTKHALPEVAPPGNDPCAQLAALHKEAGRDVRRQEKPQD